MVTIGTWANWTRMTLSASSGMLLLLDAFCLTGLAGCQNDGPTATTTVTSVERPRAATWRVIASSASPETDVKILDAVDAELLRRRIAIRIVTVEGQVDHILDIEVRRAHRISAVRAGASGATSRPGARSSTIRFFDATETVREGRDSAFAVERTFETGAPRPDVPDDIAADPVRSLAFQIGEQLEHPSPTASTKP